MFGMVQDVKSLQQTFREIVLEYQDRVYNQAFRMLGNHEDAEEATQDIFMNVHRSLEEFRGDSKMSTWIYRITSNVCISKLRKKQLAMSSMDDPIGEDGATLGDLIPDAASDHTAELELAETSELIRDQVKQLPPDWAMAISLFHFDDKSYEEIADIMEIPKATVATYIFRGRKQLAKSLINVLYA